MPSLDRVFLEDNWLFFLLSLVAGVEGLADVLVWVELESSWSFITMSWLFASSMVFTSSSESSGSVCIRFEFNCLSLVLGSVDVNRYSISWEMGWVLDEIDSDVYWRMLGCWLVSCYWLLCGNSCGVTLCSSRVTLIILIMFTFMMLICCVIISSNVLINVV